MAKRRGRSASFMRSINPHLKNRRRKVYKSRSRRKGMARRRSYSRKTRSRRRSGMGTMGAVLIGVVGGAVGYAIVDAFLHPILSSVPAMVILGLEFAGGIYLATSKKGWMRSLGLALAIIPAFIVARQYLAPVLGNLVGIVA